MFAFLEACGLRDRPYWSSADTYRHFEDVVLDIPAVVTERPGRGVAEHDRRRADAQGVCHRLLRNVSQIYQHPHPVHLQNQRLQQNQIIQ